MGFNRLCNKQVVLVDLRGFPLQSMLKEYSVECEVQTDINMMDNNVVTSWLMA